MEEVLTEAGASLEEIEAAIQKHLQKKFGQFFSYALTDGTGKSHSIQTSQRHMCFPENEIGPWKTVEIFSDNEDNPRGYVPIREIAEMFFAAGGRIVILPGEKTALEAALLVR
jgi:hypothetical protein